MSRCAEVYVDRSSESFGEEKQLGLVCYPGVYPLSKFLRFVRHPDPRVGTYL